MDAFLLCWTAVDSRCSCMLSIKGHAQLRTCSFSIGAPQYGQHCIEGAQLASCIVLSFDLLLNLGTQSITSIL
jgi:hypothetical protein